MSHWSGLSTDSKRPKVNRASSFVASEPEVKSFPCRFTGSSFSRTPPCDSGATFSGANTALLQENPAPSREDIKHWMMGNLCRCTGYYKIAESIEAAAAVMRGEQPPPPAGS